MNYNSNPKHSRPFLPLITEDAVARDFAQTHSDSIRYDSEDGWHVYAGTHWKADKATVIERIRHHCQHHARNRGDEVRGRLGKASFINNVERLARTDQLLRVMSGEWDKDPWLLATPGGTVDLRTGALRPSKPEDMIRKLTAVTPSENENCHVWLGFLEQANVGNRDAIAFQRCWLGYGLTGLTVEQKLAFFYGPGGNGKGVVLRTAVSVMGDYAKVASMSTFTAKKYEAHPEEIANLVGTRFVTASETEQGHAWATARIKELTGGDPISTRRMYKERFTFPPQFKLNFAGNHAPNFGAVDNAIRRRLIVIPFEFTPEQPDLELEEKLRAEWPGILRWMINGCLEWQRNGLPVPEALQVATNDYLAVQDTFGEWFDERCELATDDICTGSTELFRSWESFAENRGERPGTYSSFAERMQRATGRRPEQIKKLGKKGYRGVRLK